MSAGSSQVNTTQINERLGGVKVTGELIIELGIEPTRREKRAMYWDESLFPTICRQLVYHIQTAVHPVNASNTTADDLFGE